MVQLVSVPGGTFSTPAFWNNTLYYFLEITARVELLVFSSRRIHSRRILLPQLQLLLFSPAPRLRFPHTEPPTASFGQLIPIRMEPTVPRSEPRALRFFMRSTPQISAPSFGIALRIPWILPATP